MIMSIQKMKYLTIFSFITLISLFASSCDNDFNINDDWKDITVVYGLLDPAADTNWVRVQRAYLGEAAASASYGEVDSLYYDTTAISVYLLAYTRGADGSLGNPVDSITLKPDFTSRKLNDGIYTTDGFRLYRTTEDIEEEKTYRLMVKKTNTNHPDASSITEIVGAKLQGNNGFRFVLPNPNVVSARIFNGRIEWYQSKLAEIYEVDVYFFYKEYNRQTGAIEHLSQKIDYATLEGIQALPDASGKVELSGDPFDLYTKLSSALPELKPNTLRFFKSITIEIWSGGEDLAKFIELNKPTEGVNSSKPEFPDIENGVGLFSSRTSIDIDNVAMTNEMSTSYYLSSALCDKGFAIVTSGDTCYCTRTPGIGPEKTCF